MIDSLTEFTVVPEYHRSRMLYHVHVKGAPEPVAQARADRAPGSPGLLKVFTGPGLDQPAGWVNADLAAAADRRRLGNVAGRYRAGSKGRWTFAQDGLPVLQGTRAGIVGTLRDSLPVVRDFLTGGIADAALSARLKFSAPDCAGFEFTRQPGIRTSYTVTIYDERISRLLVLAAIRNFDYHSNSDVRREAIDTVNDFGDVFKT